MKVKIYSLPKELAWTEPDYATYDTNAEHAREQEHSARLKEWLQKNGYNGPLTGEEYREGAGDGYARYMVGDKGSKSILIHLPYGDAWHGRSLRYMTPNDVLTEVRRIKEADKKWAAMVAAKAERKAEASAS